MGKTLEAHVTELDTELLKTKVEIVQFDSSKVIFTGTAQEAMTLYRDREIVGINNFDGAMRFYVSEPLAVSHKQK